jgi:hypothetical protein
MRIPVTIRHSCELVLHLEQNVPVYKKTGSSGSSDFAQCVLRIIANDLGELAIVLIRVDQLIQSWEWLTHSSPAKAQAANDWTKLLVSGIQEIINEGGLECHVTIKHK